MSNLSQFIGLLLGGVVILVILVAGIGKWRQVRQRRAVLALAQLAEGGGVVTPQSSGGKGEEK